MTEFLQMSAVELGRAIKSGDLSAMEAVRMQLDAIRRGDDCNAFITVLGDEAMKKAENIQKQIESGELSGPLAGVPIVIKDNICTKGVKTSCASRILGDFRPPYDATVVEKLEAAGAVIVAKTNMDDFAMGSTSETSFSGAGKNPWDASRVPAGRPAAARPPWQAAQPSAPWDPTRVGASASRRPTAA
jgi:aspartyl-tRNA(Asn)/glutamyl-tRNA(Gln) amidotransferase subunit A